MKKPTRISQWLMLGVALPVACLSVLAQGATGAAGWYTTAQAANGAKVYKTTCAGCHGAKLQGGMGPALVGRQFWLTYAGKKASTLWSAVHTTMPMAAPGSVSARNSINVMAFLLRQNRVPAGTTPLDDTTDLSKALPAK